MRIRIIFGLKNKGAILPFHHQKQIRALIKEMVGDDYLKVHSQFNFSGLKGQTKVGREGLHYFSKRVTLVFSSYDAEFINYFINKLFDHEHILLGDLILEPEFVEREFTSTPFGNSCKFLCLSPLVIAESENNDKNKEFTHPSHDAFSDLLYESTMARMENSGYYSPEQIASFFKFQIVPDKTYIEKINQNDKKFARIYTILHNGKIKEVRGYTFPFELYAAPEVLDFIYNGGLGELTNMGFGMLDLADSAIPKKEIIFERDFKKLKAQP